MATDQEILAWMAAHADGLTVPWGGLPGRFRGVTFTGVPTEGQFQAGDYLVAQYGNVICLRGGDASVAGQTIWRGPDTVPHLLLAASAVTQAAVTLTAPWLFIARTVTQATMDVTYDM